MISFVHFFNNFMVIIASFQVRTRRVEIYAQFGGVPCSGEATQNQPCVPQMSCPLDIGCGDRFRCSTGMLQICRGYFFQK